VVIVDDCSSIPLQKPYDSGLTHFEQRSSTGPGGHGQE